MYNMTLLIAVFTLPTTSALAVTRIDKATLDVTASSATWTAKKLAGTHTGKISFKEGEFEFKKGKLVKGEVEADLNSITDEDLKDADSNKKLLGHLKSEDFFDTAKFPVATFKITSMNDVYSIVAGQPNLDVKGMLTIHGITKPFQTKVFYTPSDTGFSVTGKITIERTQYGLKYHSKKFFDPKVLGDKLIEDQFDVELNLVAKK